MIRLTDSETETTAPAPDLSVVVVILGGPAYVPRCIDSLLQQDGEQVIEIIVPHDDRISGVDELRRRYPDVQFLHLAGERTYAELRAFAVRAARAKVVAITEDHCAPAHDWCSQIWNAHQERYAAVGGAVDKKRPDRLLNWAIYLCDFSRYANPVNEGPSEYLTDCNVSYKRAALESIAEIWREEFHETSVNWTLRDRGESLWLTPNILVHQQRSLGLGPALRERYSFGRLFASTRVAAVSFPKRIAYALASGLLPAILIARVARNVIGKRRYMGEFVGAFPAVVLMASVWALGEFVGYLTGRAGKVTALFASSGAAAG